jgi:hypothetical protein
MRFLRHGSGVPGQKKRPLTCWARGQCAMGTPSAWIFLVRLHACRAGLRFSRLCHSTVPMGESQQRAIVAGKRDRS